jgi:hypothetical protein
MIRKDWKSKKARKMKNANNNPGGQKKGPNCTTDTQKKFFFCSPKAYKHRDYASWHQWSRELNKVS